MASLYSKMLVVSLSMMAGPALAGERLKMVAASPNMLAVMTRYLGSAFVKGDGAFPAKLLIARPHLNRDKARDLVAVQKGLCSNHSCEFKFLAASGRAWSVVGSFDSWGTPYVEPNPNSRWADVIVFEKVTDDCMACSPPRPVRYSRKGNSYVRVGEVNRKEARRYRQIWD